MPRELPRFGMSQPPGRTPCDWPGGACERVCGRPRARCRRACFGSRLRDEGWDKGRRRGPGARRGADHGLLAAPRWRHQAAADAASAPPCARQHAALAPRPARPAVHARRGGGCSRGGVRMASARGGARVAAAPLAGALSLRRGGVRRVLTAAWVCCVRSGGAGRRGGDRACGTCGLPDRDPFLRCQPDPQS